MAAEVAIAASAVAVGFTWHVTDSPELNGGLAVVWIVGLTNSFNLLDNMDGLASTAAACSLVALALIVPSSAALALPLAGAALGFWFVNRPPARMFMGDTGSLMLGFGVALCSIDAANTDRGLHSLVILAFPLALAIFDTSLVILGKIFWIDRGGAEWFFSPLFLLLPVVIAVGCLWGDLVESLLKRQFEVKDTGSWLPGFGGLLDRIDSLLFVLPLVYSLLVVMG